MNVTVNLFQDT
jgi:hypothetical protein